MTNDPNRTMLGQAPVLDPNKTIMGSGPSLNATQTIKPVQCPVCKTFNPIGMMFCVDCGLIFDRALPGDAFGAPAVQLPTLVEETGKAHALRPGPNVLGRQGDISFEDTRVSRRHCQVTLEGMTLAVEDLGSTNGTKVRGARLAAGEKVTVAQGETIDLGGFVLSVSLPGEATKTQMAMSGKTSAMAAVPTVDDAPAWLMVNGEKKPLRKGINKFGRKSENDVVIVDPYVSGSHGVFELTDDAVYLTDTGSSNGTLVNEAKLEVGQKTKIGPDDEILIGSIEIRVEYKKA